MKKILVVSDLHLNKKFNQKKFAVLKKLFSSKKYRLIIILGDFFEGYKITVDQFLNSPWSKLFPLLKKKKSIYIIGNHDYSALNRKKEFEGIFKKVGENYQLKIKNKKIFFVHGHQFYPSIDVIFKFNKLPFFVNKFLFSIYNYEKKHYQRSLDYAAKKSYFLTKDNFEIIKNFKKINNEKNCWLITGHCHNPIISKKYQYIDVGFFEEKFYSYLEINENGEFKLKIKKTF